MSTNIASCNDITQAAAHKKLQRLNRYGSHRVKVAVRRHGSKNPVEALQAVKASLVGRLVVRDIRRVVKLMAIPAGKLQTGAWIKDEFSDSLQFSKGREASNA
jgi:hypothetical protein